MEKVTSNIISYSIFVRKKLFLAIEIEADKIKGDQKFKLWASLFTLYSFTFYHKNVSSLIARFQAQSL